jgi:hypothetical protein
MAAPAKSKPSGHGLFRIMLTIAVACAVGALLGVLAAHIGH